MLEKLLLVWGIIALIYYCINLSYSHRYNNIIIIHRYCHGQFPDNASPTIGASFLQSRIELEGTELSLQVSPPCVYMYVLMPVCIHVCKCKSICMFSYIRVCLYVCIIEIICYYLCALKWMRVRHNLNDFFILFAAWIDLGYGRSRTF